MGVEGTFSCAARRLRRGCERIVRDRVRFRAKWWIDGAFQGVLRVKWWNFY